MTIRVAVIDDDEFIGEFFQTILESIGSEVVYICDPSKAVNRLKEFDPHIIFIDFCMPGVNGVKLRVDLLKNDIKGKVIFISSIDNDAAISTMIETSDYGFIRKPLHPEDICVITEFGGSMAKMSRLAERLSKIKD